MRKKFVGRRKKKRTWHLRELRQRQEHRARRKGGISASHHVGTGVQVREKREQIPWGSK